MLGHVLSVYNKKTKTFEGVHEKKKKMKWKL